MAFVDDAFYRRVIVHRPNVISDVVEIQSDACARAVDFFLCCASTQSHDCAAVLLGFRAAAVKQVADIVNAHEIGDADFAGFSVHFHFHKMCLAAHDIHLRMRLPVQRQAAHIGSGRMDDCRILTPESIRHFFYGLSVGRICLFKNISILDIEIFGLFSRKHRLAAAHHGHRHHPLAGPHGIA